MYQPRQGDSLKQDGQGHRRMKGQMRFSEELVLSMMLSASPGPPTGGEPTSGPT